MTLKILIIGKTANLMGNSLKALQAKETTCEIHGKFHFSKLKKRNRGQNCV